MKKIKALITTSLLILCFLHVPLEARPTSYCGYIALSEYSIHCSPEGVHGWGKENCGGERVRGWNRFNNVWFHFLRNKGSWVDYLTDDNTYEDCLLEDAHQYLQVWGLTCLGFRFSNISPLLWQHKNGLKKDVPYVEGEGFNPNGCKSGFFRLYMFPTKDEKSTYYLCVEIESFVKTERVEKNFDIVFDFVSPWGR